MIFKNGLQRYATDTIRTKFFMIIYSQRILKNCWWNCSNWLFQKAGANIGNILTANKLICIISEKKCKTVYIFSQWPQIFKKRTQRYEPMPIHSKSFEKIIPKNLWKTCPAQENNLEDTSPQLKTIHVKEQKIPPSVVP